MPQKEIDKMVHHLRTCECTDGDWECDEGFERLEKDSYICYPINHMQKQISDAESTCVFGEYFYIPSGYRKIPGNICENGL